MSTNVFFIETLAIVYVLLNGLKSMQIDQKKHPIKSGYLAVSKTNGPPSVIFHKRNQKEPRKYSLSKQREECVPVEMAQFTYTIESEL